MIDDVDEFKKQLFKVVTWYKNNNTYKGIDLMDSKEIKEDFKKLNLDNSFYLHKSYCEVK